MKKSGDFQGKVQCTLDNFLFLIFLILLVRLNIGDCNTNHGSPFLKEDSVKCRYTGRILWFCIIEVISYMHGHCIFLYVSDKQELVSNSNQ